MRYGQTSNEYNEEEEVTSEQADETADFIPHVRKNKCDNTNLPGIGIRIRIPNSMMGIGLSANGPGFTYITPQSANPNIYHDSTPRKTNIPNAMVGMRTPRIGGNLVMKKKIEKK